MGSLALGMNRPLEVEKELSGDTTKGALHHGAPSGVRQTTRSAFGFENRDETKREIRVAGWKEKSRVGGVTEREVIHSPLSLAWITLCDTGDIPLIVKPDDGLLGEYTTAGMD